MLPGGACRTLVGAAWPPAAQARRAGNCQCIPRRKVRYPQCSPHPPVRTSHAPPTLPTPHLQGGNELWLAVALSHPVMATLTGPQLSALLGALLSPEVLSKPVSVWAAYSVSPEVSAKCAINEPEKRA